MSYTLRLLEKAKSDFRAFYDFIEERSPEGAERWAEAFEKGADQLRRIPHSCGIAPEYGLSGYKFRQLLFRTKHGQTYRAVFIIREKEVVVFRIRGKGQKNLTKRDV